MFKILNRISIVLSIVLGFCITMLLIIYFGGISYFGEEEIIIFLILNTIFALIIKSLFFSKIFISQRLEFFYEAIKKREQHKINDLKTTKKDTIKENIETKNKEIEENNKKIKNKKTDNNIKKILKNILAKNILAKIGVLLVFLGVVFLLALVWNEIPTLIKLIFGFLIGFSIYFAGILLDKKGIKQESKILIGSGLLINFLVILGGKFILEGSNFEENYLSTITTFILLILNTIFAIVTGLLYKSKFIIYISFLFAFINPFLTGGDSETPYALLVYSIIVSIGTIVVGIIQKDKKLLLSGFILSSIIYLIAPFDSQIGLLSKIIVTILSGLAYIVSLIKIDFNKTDIIFSILGLFVALNSCYFISSFDEIINNITLIIISIIIIGYLIINYIFSIEKKYSNLYSIGSLFSIISISLLLYTKDEISLTIFFIIISIGLLVTIFPFFNKNILGEDNSLANINIGNIAGIIFLGGFLFRYGNETISGLTLGFAFVGLAIYYFILGIIITYKFPIEKTVNIEKIKNNLYSYFAIAISLFTLSIALIFEESNIIISIIWLIEASILFLMYNKTGKQKIFYIALIIFFIGILKIFEYSGDIISGNYYSLISIFIITGLLIFNIRNTKYKKDFSITNIFHDILHILGLIGIFVLIKNLVDIQGLNVLLTSIIIASLGGVYAYYGSNILKIFYILGITLFSYIHIGYFEYLSLKDSNQFLYLNYFTTGFIAIGVYLYNRLNIIRTQKIILNVIFLIYSLIIISLFIYNYFQDTFAITIFWGVISILFIGKGISNNKIKYRTLGLYLLSLVILKVFLFDIWYSIEDAISRVVVFIVLGILLIIVSVKYSKKYGDNLIGEFNLKNFNKVDIIHEIKDEENNKIIIDKEKIISQIKKIDISDIEIACFKVNGKTSFTTKSKNLLQITKYVINKTGKLEYGECELSDFYEFLITNYISELSSRDLKKVKEAFKDFVEKGGEIILK